MTDYCLVEWTLNKENGKYGCFAQFEEPHQIIHSIAEKVFALEKNGDMAGARKMIAECRDHELAQMIGLFAQAKQYYRTQNREISVVLEHQRELVAMAVDSIEAVEHFEEGSVAEAPSTFSTAKETRLVTLTGRRRHNGSMVLILDAEQIVGNHGTVS